MIGTDIAPTAIAVSELFWEKERSAELKPPKFIVDDLTCSSDWETSTRVDLIHDKGTLDVFVLQKRTEEAIGAILRRFGSPGGMLIITSSNLTAEEMIAKIEGCDSHPTARLRQLDSMSEGVPKFTFGGRQGQTVSTVAFVVVAKNANEVS